MIGLLLEGTAVSWAQTVHCRVERLHHPPYTFLSAKISWAEGIGEIVVGMARVECGDQVGVRSATGNLTE